MYLRHNTFTEDLPIRIVLTAMGLESDQEMFQLVRKKNFSATVRRVVNLDCVI